MTGRTSALGCLLALVLLAGCSPARTGTPAAATTAAATTTAPAPLRVVAVGDSITEADSPDFDDGLIGPGSWAWTATGDGVDVLGGWAHGGATSADMAAGVGPMDADVLVVMAGNNDVDDGVPVADVVANVRQVVVRAGVPRVVLSAAAPEDGYGPQLTRLDAALQGLAGREGWQWVDPMTDVRGPDGGWVTGTSPDGVHPDVEAARVVGRALRAALTG
ncbi:SGNH/GDSL hydrolase family protein [Goekera deserti]|uniref:SGNH/GDSL hydrolase family protein n=1 Tax=Goekera deserti TaxID=2497753 RepID=A0A7K3WFJ9_9ACTN|nr:SGNH/GDSL hydrolase family protein [Goekera deserti]NDI46932.1 hypothetical protein [Goekera deserti]NEL54500.1 SGNH/GDSL hydrolase family protein [Goekera deserti]